ncbi:MAG: GTPase Era [Candidatus Omnitrophota bacterium]
MKQKTLYNVHMFKAGRVAIVGRPNVGKSTLLNALVKEKLCIVSSKPETTRDNIQGVLSGEDFQIVLVDTPGMHRPKHLLGKVMVRRATASLMDIDLAIALIDAQSGITQEDMKIFELLPEKPSFLLINKIDKTGRARILPIIDKARRFNFSEIIPISASKKDGLDVVFKKILEYMPEGFPIFPDDQLSDKNEDFFIQEIIREKVLELTYEEVPHSTAVTIEEIKERSEGTTYIRAEIYIEKTSQKGIVIGRAGSMLKKIGESARKEIETLLEKKVFLDLHVKVFENWRKDPYKLKKLGY